MSVFEKDMKSEWKLDICSETGNIHIMSTEGVLVKLLTSWGSDRPGAFDYNKEELDKMTMLLLNANKIYDMLKAFEHTEVKAIINKIENGNPEDYKIKYEE